MGQGKMGCDSSEALAEAAEVIKLTAQLYGTVQSRTDLDGTW